MSGLMAGVLFARILSGVIGEHWGWRAMYIVAAAINVIMIVIIYRLLPHNSPSKNPMPYRQLIVSLLTYFRQESELRKACLSGALMFGSFSALWGLWLCFCLVLLIISAVILLVLSVSQELQGS